MSQIDTNIFLFLGFGLFFFLLMGIGIALNVWWVSRQESRRLEREAALKKDMLEREAALKKDMLERGLSADEIERVIRATAEQPEPPAKVVDKETEVAGQFGALLGCCEPNSLEEMFALFKAADAATRRAIVSAVSEMYEHSENGELTDEQIRAVVRGLARPSATSTESATAAIDLPPLTGSASRIADSLRFSERPGV
jgi:hypothetical protein